ncbi:ABC transporter permease [Streptomyces bikiniensis]|uniref:ABC transporter permease n=1 Tax=Streptomyces bikiniensis TaxID=1896 RepID=UPI0004C2270F|nr:FtsX-like permease family protein [Streptomyces bikiniensis]
MFRTALRNVLAHKARLLMTVLAVMLGVAFVSGTLVFTDTLSQAFRNQSAKSYDDVAVAVEMHPNPEDARQAPGLSQKDVDEVAGLDGVASVAPRVGGFAGVPDKNGKLIGVGWSNKGTNFAPGKDGKDRAYDFASGGGPVRADQIALDRASADKGGYKVGDTVRVATNGPVKEYVLSGVFTTEDGAVNAGGSLVLFETSVAQKLYLKPGYFQELTVTAASGAQPDKLLDEVLKVVPKQATAQTGQALADRQAEDIEAGLGALNQVLLGFAGIALFVGVFLIANTFTMLVAQRTKELALMRAVGASRRQITRSVLAEAGLVGLVASTVGLVLGVGLAVALRSAMNAFDLKIPAGGLVVGPAPVVSAFAVGVLITMLAAWLPGRRAAKIPPVAAMNSVHATASTKSLVLRNSVGAAFTALGVVLIVLGAGQGGDEGRMLIAGGAFLTLIGVIVLIPMLSRPVIALIRPFFVGLFGISGKLAGLNAVRNPRRTGATASALAIGLTLVTGLSVIGATVGTAIDKMTVDQIKADYMVTMASGDSLSEEAIAALAKAPGVTAVSPQQAGALEIEGSYVSASGVTPGDIEKVLNLHVVNGSLASLGQGQIAIADRTAEKRGLKVGDTVPVEYLDKAKGKLTVGAIYEESEFVSPVMIDRKLINAHEQQPYTREVYVAMEGGASAANAEALSKAMGDNPGITVMNHKDIRDAFGGPINMLLNIVYGLLGMALIIAVLGVVNTLAMSVFERQQEIGMLRAIGLDRRRVKRMVRLEAVVISVFGAVVGIGLGAFLGWAIGETFKSSLPGYALVLPWERIGVFLVLAGLVGVLASLWPARSAARLNMLAAIKTE